MMTPRRIGCRIDFTETARDTLAVRGAFSWSGRKQEDGEMKASVFIGTSVDGFIA
jgi:hypothetical protein